MVDQRKHNPDPEQLLGRLSERTQPDDARSAISKAAVRQRWQAAVEQQRHQRRQRLQWVMAASVMLLITLSLLNLRQPAEHLTHWGQVTAANGTISIRKPGNDWQTWEADMPIMSDTEIKTGANSHISLELADHSLLSMAENAQITTGDQGLILHQGQLYHDTDETGSAAPLLIKTRFGNIQHIGTQYLVNQQDQTVKVAVRSGAVEVQSNEQQANTTLRAHQQVAVSNSGIQDIQAITPHDPLWDWTFRAQPEFSLDDKTLYEFVQWYAQKTGLAVDWQGLEAATQRISLQGNILNMSQEQAIQTVFLTTSFRYHIDQGQLHISQQNQ